MDKSAEFTPNVLLKRRGHVAQGTLGLSRSNGALGIRGGRYGLFVGYWEKTLSVNSSLILWT